MLFLFYCKEDASEIIAEFNVLTIEEEIVTFKNKSSNATNYAWDFGDGNTSTETNPVHNYSTIGSYEVTLTASNDNQSKNYSETIIIGSMIPDNLHLLGELNQGFYAGPVVFTHEGNGYIGYGGNGIVFSDKFFKYGINNNSWSELDNGPEDVKFGANFKIDDKVYMGLGMQNTDGRRFLKYDITSNTHSILTNPFPVAGLSTEFFYPTAFTHNGYGYVLITDSNNPIDKAFVRFDPSTEEWTSMGQHPCSGSMLMTSFVIDDYAYAGLGRIEFNSSDTQLDFWKYDIINNTWEQLNDFPGTGTTSFSPISFSREGKGYMAFANNNDVWEYDPNSDSWTLIERFPLSISGGGENAYFGFYLDNKFFFVSPSNINSIGNELMYEYVFD